MTTCECLGAEYERALDGGAWHGPALREVLADVPRDAALRRGIANAHSIAEIVLHSTTWFDVVRQRLVGESPRVSDAEDWPEPAIDDEATWDATKERLLASGHALRETIATFPDERLHEKRPGVEGTWFELIAAELQHMLYHTGQIPILHKAAARSS